MVRVIQNALGNLQGEQFEVENLERFSTEESRKHGKWRWGKENTFVQEMHTFRNEK